MFNADSTNPFEASITSEATASQAALKRRGRLSPPLFVRLVTAALVLAAGIVRWFTITGDHATVNVLTFLCVSLACLVLGAWFVFFSGYSRSVRFGSAGFVLLVLVSFAISFRVEHVSGELVPTFRPRWAQKVDETLGSPVPVQRGARADLSQVTSDDFPQFLGPNRDGRVDHVELAHDWKVIKPRLLWKNPIGAGWSAFSAVNGFAVTLEQRGREELVTCYEIDSGRLIWSHATVTRHETIPGGTGPRSTPTIHEGIVYTLGAVGDLLALDGATGERVWNTNLLERYKVPKEEDVDGIAWGRSNSPLVVDDLVIVPAGGPANGPWVSLAAFHRKTGELVWEAGNQQVSYSSPILATIDGVRQIVCIHEKSVAGHDPKSGKILWSHDWPGRSNGDANVSQPVPIGDRELFLSKGYGKGAMLLDLKADSPQSFSVKTLWEDQTLLKTKFTNVVLYQGHVYGLSDGILECVNVSNGKRQWKKGRYLQGQILGVSDVILIQAESGEVAMVEANPEGYRELGRFTAIEGKTWNNLCLFGKRLLVRNAEQAACYELP